MQTGANISVDTTTCTVSLLDRAPVYELMRQVSGERLLTAA
jgi:hypothetical protein